VLIGSPPNVVYQPKTNFFGVDHLSFQASDGFTSSAPATVSLIITQIVDVAFSKLSIQLQSNSQPVVTLAGEPYEHYAIEASEDLLHWTTITNVISTNGIVALMISDSATYRQRFYRAELSLPQGSLSAPQLTPDGAFQINVSGELARFYQIQVSTNLLTWSPLTNLLLVNSPLSFTDPAPASLRTRFYRIRPVQ